MRHDPRNRRHPGGHRARPRDPGARDMSEHPSERHNRLKDEILAFMLPRIEAMGPEITDRLVLTETVMTAMVLFLSRRKDIALAVFGVLAEGVKDRIKKKADP